MENSDGEKGSKRTTESQDIKITNRILKQLYKFTGKDLKIGAEKKSPPVITGVMPVRKKTFLTKGQKLIKTEEIELTKPPVKSTKSKESNSKTLNSARKTIKV